MYKSVRNRSNSANRRSYGYQPASSGYSNHQNHQSPARVNNYTQSTNIYAHYQNSYSPSPAVNRSSYQRHGPSPMQSRQRDPPTEHDKILTELIKMVASEESIIEHQRQQLAINNDFEPKQVFQLIAQEGEENIEAHDILSFCDKNNLKAETTDAEDMIKEFDGTLDKKLNQEEFFQMILPAANTNVRYLALNRSQHSHYKQQDKVPFNVLGQVLNIFEKEINLQRQRSQFKRQLLKEKDFSTRKSFQKISNNYHSICMPDLLSYLESNGFYARREDIEAILRRCDHDGNQMISFEEFQELAGASEQNDEDDDFTMNANKKDQSPDRKNLKETKEHEQSLKKSNSNENLVRENMEQAADRQAREEAEAQREKKRQELEAQWKKRKEEEEERLAKAEAERKEKQEKARQEALQRKVDHYMFLRLIKYILEQYKLIEAKKELLYNHVTFSVADCFAVFDHDNKGHIVEDDFAEALSEHKLSIKDVSGLMDLLDIKKDGKIYYNEFAQALTPYKMMDYRQSRSQGYGESPYQYRCAYHQQQQNDSEFRKIRSAAWIESVVRLFDQLVENQVELSYYKQEIGLDAELLFSEIDDYKMGHISTSHLRRWIQDNCDYNVPEEDIFVLQKVLDHNNDYKITKEEFVKSIGQEQYDDDDFDEYQENENENKNKKKKKNENDLANQSMRAKVK